MAMKNLNSLTAMVIIMISNLGWTQNVLTSNPLYLCCNNNFPEYGFQYETSMRCDEIDYYPVDREVCARFWSAYMNPDTHYPGDGGPLELCDEIQDPPLPDIPIPEDFSVSATMDHHPQLNWHHYYVHWYRIYRKIGNGNWQIVASQLGHPNNYWVDYWIDSTISLNHGNYVYYHYSDRYNI